MRSTGIILQNFRICDNDVVFWYHDATAILHREFNNGAPISHNLYVFPGICGIWCSRLPRPLKDIVWESTVINSGGSFAGPRITNNLAPPTFIPSMSRIQGVVGDLETGAEGVLPESCGAAMSRKDAAVEVKASLCEATVELW